MRPPPWIHAMTESRSLAVLAGVQTLRKRRSSLREPASGPRRSGAPPCGQDGSVTAPFWSTSTVRRRTGAVGADTVTASHPAAERQARHDRRRLIVVALALVTGLGWLIVFSLMTRSQTVVPDVSDEHAARTTPRTPTTTQRQTQWGASTAAAPMNSGKTMMMKRGRLYSGRAVVE